MSLKLDILGDSRQAQKAVKDVGEALEAVGDSLDDVVKDSDRGTERMERDFREMAREVKRESRAAYDAVKKDAREAADASEDAATEVKQEIKQNLSEVASSFQGDLSSLQDLVQGTLGGLASMGGPIAAAAAAGAIGVGFISAALGNAEEKQKALEEAASDWADAYIEAGGRIITAAQQIAIYNEIATDPERYKEAEKNAELWGVSLGVALNAMAGNTWAIDEAQASLNARHEKFAAQLGDNNQQVLDQSKAIGGWRRAIQDGQDALDHYTGSMERGAAQADAYSEALRLMAEHTAGATKVVDEFGDSIYTLPSGVQIYIDAETGRATQNVDAIEKKIYALPQSTTLGLDVDTRAAERKINEFVNRDRTITVLVNGRSYGRY